MGLSEGMMVKFNLPIALSHKTEVLIPDEPTSGFDPFSRNELFEVFMELKRETASRCLARLSAFRGHVHTDESATDLWKIGAPYRTARCAIEHRCEFFFVFCDIAKLDNSQ